MTCQIVYAEVWAAEVARDRKPRRSGNPRGCEAYIADMPIYLGRWAPRVAVVKWVEAWVGVVCFVAALLPG